MVLPIPQLQRFIYSHYLLGGLRQSIGVLLPVALLGGFFKLYGIGVIASMGALCVAIVDQPGGPRRYRSNEMLGAAALGTFTAFITGLSSSTPLLIWILVPLLSFFYSMLNVFGKRGGLIGFACLLLMALTLRFPMSPNEVLLHTLFSGGGALFYFAFSTLFRRALLYREERRTLSVALFATAEYMVRRSRFYDAETDLDDNYRDLIRQQSDMTEAHQAARDMVLRELPKGGDGYAETHRIALLSLFVNMVSLLDSLVATHTDYANLRRRMAHSDFMLFARDALFKMATNVGHIALNVSRHKKTKSKQSVKAELRAMEYELERYKRSGLNTSEPEIYALLVQILRRLRNAQKTIEHMAAQTRSPTNDLPLDQYLDKSLSRFLSREDIRLGMFTSNLRWSSSHFRYAVRVSCATLLGLTVPTIVSYFSPDIEVLSALTSYSHWIILTSLVIMKPGFALTRQRNSWRLSGTVLGCALTFLLFKFTDQKEVYLSFMLFAYILGNSLVQINFMLSAVFNTVFVLISFHFLHVGDTFVIGERLIDTIIGSVIALACSYILPKWESSSMSLFAKEALVANRNYLQTGLHYAALNRQHNAATVLPDANTRALALSPEQLAQLERDLSDADTQWQLARRNVNVLFSNFASGFYRMMNEPVSRQYNVALLNNLIIQNHVLASQISAAIPLLASLPEIPDGVATALTAIELEINNMDAPPIGSLETEGDLAMLAYPLRQMIKATQLIRQDMRGLVLSSGPPSPTQLELLTSTPDVGTQR